MNNNEIIKIPELFILDCIRTKRINMVQVFVSHKIVSRLHLNARGEELRVLLKEKYSPEQTSMLLKEWRNMPFIEYNVEKDTYKILHNVEKYYNSLGEYNHRYTGIKKFNISDLKYTGNTLTRFLYCEVMYGRGPISISRETITDITGLTRQTQRKAEQEFGVTVEAQDIEIDKKKINLNGVGRRLKTINGNLYAQHTNCYEYQPVSHNVKDKHRLKHNCSKVYVAYKNKLMVAKDFILMFNWDTATGLKCLKPGNSFNYDYLLKESF